MRYVYGRPVTRTVHVAGDPNIDNTYGALVLGAVLGSLMILRALGIA